MKYDSLEIARIIGEPKDPRKPYPDIVKEICELDKSAPNEYLYHYDVLLETDKVYTTVASGVTQVAVSVDTPALLTFIDRATPEYYAKLTDLANSKERTLARKNKTISRTLDAYEIYYLLQAVDSAATAQGNTVTLDSGTDHYTFKNLIDQIEQVVDYGDKYVLIAGSLIDKDIKLWNWTDNKNQSILDAFKELNVGVKRTKGNITLDGSVTAILATNTAYLVAEETAIGKPCLFVRKQLNEIEGVGGIITNNDENELPERLVFVSPNPVSVGTNNTRYLAVGLTGYENIVTAVGNAYGISKFTRT